MGLSRADPRGIVVELGPRLLLNGGQRFGQVVPNSQQVQESKRPGDSLPELRGFMSLSSWTPVILGIGTTAAPAQPQGRLQRSPVELGVFCIWRRQQAMIQSGSLWKPHFLYKNLSILKNCSRSTCICIFVWVAWLENGRNFSTRPFYSLKDKLFFFCLASNIPLVAKILPEKVELRL